MKNTKQLNLWMGSPNVYYLGSRRNYASWQSLASQAVLTLYYSPDTKTVSRAEICVGNGCSNRTVFEERDSRSEQKQKLEQCPVIFYDEVDHWDKLDLSYAYPKATTGESGVWTGNPWEFGEDHALRYACWWDDSSDDGLDLKLWYSKSGAMLVRAEVVDGRTERGRVILDETDDPVRNRLGFLLATGISLPKVDSWHKLQLKDAVDRGGRDFWQWLDDFVRVSGDKISEGWKPLVQTLIQMSPLKNKNAL